LTTIQQNFMALNQAALSQNNTAIEQHYRLRNESDSINEVSSSLFTDEQLTELKRVATEMFEKTAPGDCLLFLGRSPLWIAEMFKALNYPRDVLCIPYSGGSKLGSVINTPEEAFDAYKEFLKSKGLNTSFFDKNPDRKVYIVDRIETGMSVISFMTLVKEITPKFNKENCLILGFGDITEAESCHSGLIVMERDTLIETCKKHAQKQKYTLGVDFYSDEWGNWKQKDFNPKKSDIVVARQAQIASWVQKIRVKKGSSPNNGHKPKYLFFNFIVLSLYLNQALVLYQLLFW